MAVVEGEESGDEDGEWDGDGEYLKEREGLGLWNVLCFGPRDLVEDDVRIVDLREEELLLEDESFVESLILVEAALFTELLALLESEDSANANCSVLTEDFRFITSVGSVGWGSRENGTRRLSRSPL